MLKQFLGTSLLFALSLGFFFTSCDNEDVQVPTTEEYVDQALFIIQEEGNIGRFGCFELVFPLAIEFPDETMIAVEDYEGLATAIQEWRENNPTPNGHPTFVFPIDVMSQEGDLITVNDRSDLRELRRECGRDYFQGRDFRGHRGHCQPCFTLTFPVTIELPDETTVTVESRQELKETIHQWKEDNPGVPGRPHLTFPVTVEMNDTGELVTVNSREELKELRESCN